MLVAFEGIDGSGKGTQAALLAQRAAEAGLTVASYSFPGYTANEFGRAVGRYLNGEFGDVSQVAPQLAALLYAGDRFATKEALLVSCHDCSLVIADRYVPSNLAHQAAKLAEADRPAFIDWISSIEYNVYGLPRAAMVFYLDIPVSTASELVLRKKKRNYTDLAADIHESDLDYLRRCRDVYESLASQDVTGEWQRIACTSGGTLRDPAAIAGDIWQRITHHLAAAGVSN